MKLEFFYKGEKLTFCQYFMKHWVAFTLALSIVLSSISFMCQDFFSAGNLLFALALFACIGLGVGFVLNNKYSVNKALCILIFCVILICGFIWLRGLDNSTYPSAYILGSGVIVLTLTYIILLLTKKATFENGIIFLFLLGLLLRFCYVLFTDWTTRQHDLYGFYLEQVANGGNYGGHGAYISYLFLNNFKLFDFDPTLIDQFYHPPLHYMICALWWKIQSILGILDGYSFESLQMLTLFYSSVCMILTYRIGKQLNLNGISLILCFAIMAVHPTFIIFAGSINNDILSVMLMLFALYYAIKWFQKGKLLDIILCGISIGLAMLTKLSAYMICIPIAVIFLIKFFKDYKVQQENIKGFWKRYICHFGLFLLFCAPLALFWSLRNLILFDVPITYVQRLPDDSWQYVGDYSFLQRIFMISPNKYISHYSLFDQWTDRGDGLYNEFNPMVSLLKTSMFGEYINASEFPLISGSADCLFFVNLVLAVLSFISPIFVIVFELKNKENSSVFNEKIALCVLYFSMLVFYYIFCFTHPHHCTMNIRYVSPLIFAGSIFIGIAFDDFNSINKDGFKDVKQIVSISVLGITIAFVLCSVIFVFMMAKSLPKRVY